MAKGKIFGMKTTDILLLAGAGVVAYLIFKAKAAPPPPLYAPGYMPPLAQGSANTSNAAALAAGAAAGTLIDQLISGDQMNGIPMDGE